MPKNKICKTIHQYNKEPVCEADMRKLQEIADDYSRVKNYTYQRYGGVGSLSKLYPGYTIQNEMTASGLRGELNLPSVYFYLAVFDALGDIKAQWTRTKTKVLTLIGQNENLSDDEKHYLRFLLKVDNAFAAVLNKEPIELTAEIQAQHDELAQSIDISKLHRYLSRQVRKYHVKLHTDNVQGFSMAERAYRYGDHGIYISTKEKRRRIFVPLTDTNQYKSQLYIKLYPTQEGLEIKVPIKVAVHKHEDYTKQLGIATGMNVMFTTNEGQRYGEKLGHYQLEYSEWLREQTSIYNKNRNENSGRKKYMAKKNRLEEQLHSYINHELNRFLQTEKPKTIYIVRLPKPQAGGKSKKINNFVNMWQRGYIRKRLEQKCKEQSIEIVEVLGKDISNECSQCGELGSKTDGIFTCRDCGYEIEEKTNTARNILKRGTSGKIIN